MAHEKYIITRRAFAVGALASAAGASHALAQSITPGSTIGPFYPAGYRGETDADLSRIAGHTERAKGQVIEVMGRVLDRNGNPITGAKLEIWQANTHGRYAHPEDVATMPLDPDFQGFATIHTGSDGSWKITTIKPGTYDSPIGYRTPHIHMDVSGMTSRNIMQMYFADEQEANAVDGLYRELGDSAPLSTAKALGDHRYGWDIVLIEG
ncbi:hypothetical protein [Altererythrobacter sp. MF3-039]|uniref:dioxygenase family protein n=1 Tax=Altererythrobacter sp. MF3-039 TaxID=3252901 RepID=UPI00390CAE3A